MEKESQVLSQENKNCVTRLVLILKALHQLMFSRHTQGTNKALTPSCTFIAQASCTSIQSSEGLKPKKPQELSSLHILVKNTPIIPSEKQLVDVVIFNHLYSNLYCVPFMKEQQHQQRGKKGSTDCYYILHCSGHPTLDQPTLACNATKMKIPALYYPSTNQERICSVEQKSCRCRSLDPAL